MSLTKREMIMLIFLIIIAVVFVEYRFIIVPGIARYDALVAEKLQVENQVSTIQLNLAIAKQNEKKRDENLADIRNIAQRYFGELQMDALLVRTHDLLLEQGFATSQYQLQQIVSGSLTPSLATEFDLSYQLKQLATTYQSLSDNEKNPDENPEPSPVITDDQVEQYQISINARATYTQVKAFLDAIQNLQKSVVLSEMSLVPDLSVDEPEEPEEPVLPNEPQPTPTPTSAPEPEEQMLDVHLTMYYYGIVKLVPTDDDFNKWYREPFSPVTYTPFKQPPVATPEPSEPEVVEG